MCTPWQDAGCVRTNNLAQKKMLYLSNPPDPKKKESPYPKMQTGLQIRFAHLNFNIGKLP